ncbi:conserved Plasmodium protein, unknown function [Plasmodium vivax]|uniref:Uncharacterized protein n=6 Tax=Plasmodium vivax TaxID=5855 RepID=A5K868_PLAVS|nr:hypothetical protein, conserved [Plasmodium vivax]KMZ79239.1 hypothetical protein PVIIG_01713 [Plasmodium vivax India VII]KMZ85383.1 hypothetical protein PVBG_02069 [Plasmodium vivax Brazil I]KMZ91260.1 hypothetical protein PVMG_00134 [Plasmodium vivax Mauritania I]KMZ98299.1 hypothetical protein PVNG_03440 [Plasmodium vivax North Korean]EDL44482.1 hypothetical protein, conserved [Plasmodium vivax]|eukprot:XP_001614209.1 hypothetical protein [Plasmodium vivax Sal-1]
MNNNFQNENFKEDNYIKAWIKQSENPELYKNWNDIEEQSYPNELVKVVDFNNFNSNLINTIMTEHSLEMSKKKKKRKAYSLFYSNEINPESYNHTCNEEYPNYYHNCMYPSCDDSDVKYFSSLDKTPVGGSMADRPKLQLKEEKKRMSIKKMKRENICTENNYNDMMICGNFINSSSPLIKLKELTKPSYGSESTSEFFNNYEFETPVKVLSSKKKSYDYKNKKDNSTTNTTKENSSQENASSNNSETKRTINFSNKTEDFNDLHYNSENDYLTSSEYVDDDDSSRCSNKKQSEVNFLGQRLDYKVVGNVINISKDHPHFTML